MLEKIKQITLQNLRYAEQMLLQDVGAMSHAQLNQSRGGATRKPYDFLYECSLMNQRMAARFRGEDPGPRPYPEGEFPTAPEEFCDKERALQMLRTSFDELRAATEALSPEALHQPLPYGQGQYSAFELVGFAVSHLSYHDGQLNYIQALDGDGAVHWDFS
ncbi:MAG: hypothetical protein KatS3mg015_0011 [Fimbriimonadales bacterium]|nr:MAG: hypothetical protein KatS3mg015_0011 [Fimbriimonadales bacterium]